MVINRCSISLLSLLNKYLEQNFLFLSFENLIEKKKKKEEALRYDAGAIIPAIENEIMTEISEDLYSSSNLFRIY